MTIIELELEKAAREHPVEFMESVIVARLTAIAEAKTAREWFMSNKKGKGTFLKVASLLGFGQKQIDAIRAQC